MYALLNRRIDGVFISVSAILKEAEEGEGGGMQQSGIVEMIRTWAGRKFREHKILDMSCECGQVICPRTNSRKFLPRESKKWIRSDTIPQILHSCAVAAVVVLLVLFLVQKRLPLNYCALLYQRNHWFLRFRSCSCWVVGRGPPPSLSKASFFCCCCCWWDIIFGFSFQLADVNWLLMCFGRRMCSQRFVVISVGELQLEFHHV